MITTPVADFIEAYQNSGTVRLHMPGHKGKGAPENALDLTEIDGAGDLFAEKGIVAESEENASAVFGFRTYYSTEGASLAIRTMLALAVSDGNRTVLAARNAHRSYLSAAILLDLKTEWLCGNMPAGVLFCSVTPDQTERALWEMRRAGRLPAAVYITSPDYLGNMLDIRGIAAVCRRYHVLLLVDNAHGAYLRFLPESLHPMDLGADLCVDSAHKTLPVLTGGAYLHLSRSAEKRFADLVKETMALFASSSPSYLILRSLDLANPYLTAFSGSLRTFLPQCSALKRRLKENGYELTGDEPLKLTLRTKPYGYTGDSFARILTGEALVPEFHDPDHLTCMLSPLNTTGELDRLADVLCAQPHRTQIDEKPPRFRLPERVLSPREAFFRPRERIPTRSACGRICASVSVSCPPAVPIVAAGERIDEGAVRLMLYYGTEEISVVRSEAEQTPVS